MSIRPTLSRLHAPRPAGGASEPGPARSPRPSDRRADPRHRARRLAAAATAAATVTLTLAGCRAGWLALGDTPMEAQAHGVGLLDAVARRYLNVERVGGYATARGKLGRHALSPSQIFGDTALWTARPDDRTRVLLAEGVATADNRYRFAPRADAPLPDRPADARHANILVRGTAEGEYEWRTAVDFALGAISPADWSAGVRALYRSAEGRSSADLRADLRSTLPRATAAFGRLFSLDSLEARPLADGSTAVTVMTRVHPDWIKPQYPQYARFLRKYVSPAHYRVTLRDRANVRWLDASADDRGLLFRLRVKDGGLVPLDGAGRPMPDTLRISVDLSTRFSLFRVGVRNLRGIVVAKRSATERTWFMRFDQAPDWQLPLFTESMLRTPLRRPFEQGGITGTVGFKRLPTGQTSFTREFRVAVQESAITRFLGGLGGGAFSEFEGPAEREENRFNYELFTALREDLRTHRYGF